MRVHILLADSAGSQWYRVDEPARVAALAGVEVTVTREIDVTAGRKPDGTTIVTEVHTDADVLVIQRPLRQTMHAVAQQASKQGVAVVVELDDDFWTVSPYNLASRAIDPRNMPLHNIGWLDATLKVADMATVSTTALLKVHPQARVVPNYISRAITWMSRPPDRPATVIGWTGSMVTHPFDLQVMKGALNNRAFHVVGDPVGVQRATGAATVSSNDQWIDDLPSFWQKVADSIDVGVVPLEACAFNDAKSWLKGLEFAALGIPFVASPVAEYTRFEAYGAGLLATSAGSWRKHLDRLMTDERFYSRMAQRGLEVASRLVIEDHADEWIGAWERACTLKQSKR